MSAAALRRRVFAHLRAAVLLGWSTPLGRAARARALEIRVQLIVLRASQGGFA